MFDQIAQTFFDPARLQSILDGTQAGSDGRKVLGGDSMLGALNPLKGLTMTSPAVAAGSYMTRDSGGDYTYTDSPAVSAVYRDPQGNNYRENAPGQVQFFNSGGGWQNPTGSKRDRMQPTYQLDAQGNATPISAGGSYQPSGWVSNGRDLAKWAAIMGTAAVGGSALAGAGGGAGGGAAGGFGGIDFGGIGAAGGGAGGGGAAGGAAGGFGGGASSFAPGGFEFGGAAAGAGGAGGGAAGGAAGGGGFMSSVGAGDWAGAASAAGKWAGSTQGLQTLGGLGSAFLQNRSAGKALDAQTNATNSANNLQRDIFNQTRADYAPYRAAGTAAVGGLTNLLQNPGSITQDPGYQFGLNQGQTAIDRSAASRGGLYSGATLKALNRYGQDYGGTKLNESFNRMASVAQLGATGTAGTANAGGNYANQVGNNTTAMGNAAGGNALYQGNIWGNALNGAISAYTQPRP